MRKVLEKRELSHVISSDYQHVAILVNTRCKLIQFGGSIRQRRKALKVSQEAFAELCGLHRTYIGQVERGEKNISFNNILLIVHALKVKPSQLFAQSEF
jgi:DNA-binding XRE family transcriptional regulator